MTVKEKVPTIEDVARHAQVSTATVSRALSLPDRVSEETRKKVNEAVEAVGYTINQSARSLRVRSASTILIALPDIANSFYSSVLNAVVATAAARGFGVLVANRADADQANWLRNYFLSNRADGLLLFDGSLDPRSFAALPGPGGAFPMVFCADEDPGPGINAVLTDNMEAAARATQHLLDLGHKRIGYIHGPSKTNLPAARLLGYTTAMAEAGLHIAPEWIFNGQFSLESGYESGQRFAAMPAERRPTAIFSTNDEMAVGFIAAAREAGLRCPDDFSIVGYDDIALAPYLNPPLTTMMQPREEMGRVATDILLDIIEKKAPRGGAQRVILPSTLVIRGSTADLGKMVTPA